MTQQRLSCLFGHRLQDSRQMMALSTDTEPAAAAETDLSWKQQRGGVAHHRDGYKHGGRNRERRQHEGQTATRSEVTVSEKDLLGSESHMESPGPGLKRSSNAVVLWVPPAGSTLLFRSLHRPAQTSSSCHGQCGDTEASRQP